MKKRILKSLFWRLYISYIVVSLIVIISVILIALSSFSNFNIKQATKNLSLQLVLLSDEYEVLLLQKDYMHIDSLCKSIYVKTGTRYTVILPSGRVIGDSYQDPNKMENHKDRQEIILAQNEKIGVSTRYSNTLNKECVYAASKIINNNNNLGYVRASIPLSDVKDAIAQTDLRIIASGIALFIIVSLISFYFYTYLKKPIEKLMDDAIKLSKGELNNKITTNNFTEIENLALTMNTMASQLNEKINNVTTQRNEREAILANMIEGVIAFDMNGMLKSINPAAIKMFNLPNQNMIGIHSTEIFKNKEFCEIINTLSVNDIVTKTLEYEFKFINILGSQILDKDYNTIGILVVCNDITKTRELENLRKDFVANVSHELRTPLTSIKGFIETILDTQNTTPQKREYFLNIISNQVDRLNFIIEDLLLLSEVEKSDSKKVINEKIESKNIVNSSIEQCKNLADKNKVKVLILDDKSFYVNANSLLAEQALINLIDNAIKYSNSGTTITIKTYKEGSFVCISVIDTGCGISKEDKERIFERFYRVDKSRSRKSGGTGLGLSIVKHIMELHNGSVSVQSNIGLGSTFTLSFPCVKKV